MINILMFSLMTLTYYLIIMCMYQLLNMSKTIGYSVFDICNSAFNKFIRIKINSTYFIL